MSRYETEEEQIEAFKTWWKKNGVSLLSVLLITAIAVASWRYWTSTKMVESANASALFEVLQVNMAQGTFGEVSREALKLIQEQPQSPYASAAALLYAKYSFDKGDIETAQQNLAWVIEHSADSYLKNTASLRLARILGDQKKFADAQKNLDAIDGTTLKGAEKATYDFVVGQLALAQNDAEKAHQAFQDVVSNVEAEKNLRGLAQIQLDDLSK